MTRRLYHVAYSHQNADGSHGFGRVALRYADAPVTPLTIEAWNAIIKRDNPGMTSCVILSWQPLAEDTSEGGRDQ